MSIFKKLSDARAEFHTLKLTKTGHNSFAGYKYFELSDFLIPGMECLRKHGLVSVISFTADTATMTVHELEGDGVLHFTSPMADANLKGCHPIQNLGAVQTYQRRYLWVTALEIVEHDQLDASKPLEEPALAEERQIAIIDDHIAAGNVPESGVAWFEKRRDTMTREQAAEFIGRIKAKAA